MRTMFYTPEQVQGDINDLICMPTTSIGIKPQIEYDTYEDLASALTSDDSSLGVTHAWTVDSLAFGRSYPTEPANLDVIVSSPLVKRLLDEWVSEGIRTASGREIIGELSRSNPELSNVFRGRSYDILVHAFELPALSQETFTAVSGIDEADVSIGGITRVSLIGRSIPEYYAGVKRCVDDFKDKYASTGLPEAEAISTREQVMDMVDWSKAEEIDSVALGTSSKSTLIYELGPTFHIDNSIAGWSNLFSDVEVSLAAEMKGAKLKIDEQKLRGALLTILSGLTQLHEISGERRGVNAMMLGNSDLSELLDMIGTGREDRCMPIFKDVARRVRGALLLGKYLLVCGPSPFPGRSWVNLSKVEEKHAK